MEVAEALYRGMVPQFVPTGALKIVAAMVRIKICFEIALTLTPAKEAPTKRALFTPERGQPRCAFILAEGSRDAPMKLKRRGDGRIDISGEGICVGTAALHQDQAYYEVQIVEAEAGVVFRIGVARTRKGLTLSA